MKKIEVIIEKAGERIDKLIPLLLPEYTRSFIQGLIEDGLVTKNGKPIKSSYKSCVGDKIELIINEPQKLDVVAEDIALDIAYEDDDVLVINKPRGMVVHPAVGHEKGTLVNAVLMHCGESLSGINGILRPGIVHRLDKDTTGLLIVAKNNNAHLKLSAQLKNRSLKREYYCLVHGNIKEDSGRIDAPLARSSDDRKKIAVTQKNSKEAITDFDVLERFGMYTYVKCTLRTGRTHQIRVHMKHLGHSVVGDKSYGVKGEEFNLVGQLLHAGSISFIHPKTGEKMTFDCPLPPDFEKILQIVRNKYRQK